MITVYFFSIQMLSCLFCYFIRPFVNIKHIINNIFCEVPKYLKQRVLFQPYGKYKMQPDCLSLEMCILKNYLQDEFS